MKHHKCAKCGGHHHTHEHYSQQMIDGKVTKKQKGRESLNPPHKGVDNDVEEGPDEEEKA